MRRPRIESAVSRGAQEPVELCHACHGLSFYLGHILQFARHAALLLVASFVNSDRRSIAWKRWQMARGKSLCVDYNCCKLCHPSNRFNRLGNNLR